MKKTLWIPFLIIGCVSADTDDNRICLDYKSTTVTKEKCIPYYGTLVCGNETVTKVTCTLWEEIESGEEDEPSS